MKKRPVVISASAERDLDELELFIADSDGTERAIDVTDRLVATALSLATFPARGVVIEDLAAYGYRNLHQIQESGYMVVYLLHSTRVEVVAFVHQRRDLRSVLLARLAQ